MNIEKTEEFKLAKQLENALNNYSFNRQNFAAAIPTMHPTIQQSFYRLLRECIKVMADDNRGYDARNKASHEEAKAMLQYLEENGTPIPFV